MSAEGSVDLLVEGGVASVTFDRPEARNAMTWAMYEQLRAICERLGADDSAVSYTHLTLPTILLV